MNNKLQMLYTPIHSARQETVYVDCSRSMLFITNIWHGSQVQYTDGQLTVLLPMKQKQSQ